MFAAENKGCSLLLTLPIALCYSAPRIIRRRVGRWESLNGQFLFLRLQMLPNFYIYLYYLLTFDLVTLKKGLSTTSVPFAVRRERRAERQNSKSNVN